jgi:diguanylate cyclase
MPADSTTQERGDEGARARLRSWTRPEPWVVDQLHLTTLRRLFVVVVIAIPVHVGHLLAFAALDAHTPDQQRWRAAILLAHGLLLALMVVLALVASRLRRRVSPSPGTRLVQWGMLAVIAAASVGIAPVDQWVTPSITPFLVGSAIIGLIFLIPPMQSAVVFAVAYGAFALALGLTQHDPAVLLSNRGNGLTVVGIGWSLAVILWSAEARNVRQQRRIEQQQLELAERNRRLAQLAAHDALTGLRNRRELQRLLEVELARMRRHGHVSAVLLIDVDRFKEVNDRYGHPAGDALLQALAARLTDRLRASDLVGRWGGEEFLALLPHTSRPEALVIADDLRAEVSRAAFEVDGTRVATTVSIGVAVVDPARRAPLEDVYREVDAALYVAKRTRDCVVAAEPRPSTSG